MRKLSLLCLSLLITSCMVPMAFREPTSIRESQVAPEQRYYIVDGLSFLPPDIIDLSSTIYNDVVHFSFYHGDQGFKGYISVSKSSKGPASKEKIEMAVKKSVDRVNNFKGSITAGTLEEHWQAAKKKTSVAERAGRMETRKNGELVRVSYAFDKSEWEAIVKEFFISSLARQRDRYNSIPKHTYKWMKIKQYDCIQIDRYERLGTPVGEYAHDLGGALEHVQSFVCYVRPSHIFSIIIDMKIAKKGKHPDYEQIIKRTFDSIELDDTQPETATTFAKKMAVNNQ